METAPVGPTTSSWPSKSVAVVGVAVLKTFPSMITVPPTSMVYGTPLATPVTDERAELAVGGIELPGKTNGLLGSAVVGAVTELYTGRKLVGAGAPTVVSALEFILTGERSVSYEA